jgi:hypothetical protein
VPILDEPTMRAAVLGKIPLGQFALTDDVACAIIYLASDAGRRDGSRRRRRADFG